MIRLGMLLFALAIPVGASLLGCGCNDIIITEEFEDFCGDVPCNWEASGPVSQVATYHAEVHGVAIPAGSSLSALEAFGSRPPQLLVRCEEGAILEVNGDLKVTTRDSFSWIEGAVGQTMIRVTGSGECIVDDVGLLESCVQ